MRILHLSQHYHPLVSGVPEVVGQISRRLAQRGHDVHVGTSRPSGLAREETVSGVRVHRFSCHGSSETGIFGSIDEYIKFVRGQRWDVVVMHCVHTWSTDALLDQVAEVDGAKIVVIHGMHEPASQSYEELLVKAFKQMDALVSLSPLLRENEFCAKHGVSLPTVIPNGVDGAEWKTRERDIRSRWGILRRPWLLSVSNHAPCKNHAGFMRVVAETAAKRNDVVGTIIGSWHPAAKWRLGSLGVRGGCWYECWLRSVVTANTQLRSTALRVDVIAAIKEADLMLVTSHVEASPLVVLESMAAGTPWISFDVGCVRDHSGGIVVQSEREMVRTIHHLLSNAAERRALGDAGRSRIQGNHDWDMIARRYEEVYERVIAARRRRHSSVR